MKIFWFVIGFIVASIIVAEILSISAIIGCTILLFVIVTFIGCEIAQFRARALRKKNEQKRRESKYQHAR